MADTDISTDIETPLLTARAILDCYIETIPDERAEDRYVLWTVRDKLDEAAEIFDRGIVSVRAARNPDPASVEGEPSHGN